MTAEGPSDDARTGAAAAGDAAGAARAAGSGDVAPTSDGAVDGPDEGAVAGSIGARPSSRCRWVGLSLLTLGVLVLLSAGWVSFRTYQAYRHLEHASDQLGALQGQVKNLDSIDLAATSAAVDRLHTETDGAVRATSDPLFRLATHLPWVGADLGALRTIAGTANGLAANTAPSLVAVAKVAQPSSLSPKNGAIDIAPIAAAATTLTTADQEVRKAQGTIAGIDQGALAAPVARAVGQLQSKLGMLEQTTDKAARIGRLAPPLLGATGPRKYLVVFQNLAEARATGGLLGSYAVLTVDHGRLGLTGQGSVARDIGKIDGRFEPALPVPSGLPRALYGNLPGSFSTDTNLTPDFPIAAGLLAQMYRLQHHVTVDGVLALDPVALSYLLRGAKPIPVGHGISMTSGNITAVLLSKAYALYPESADAPARDLFLAQATGKAFIAVTQSPTNSSSVVRGLTRAANEHRVLLWSSHPAEQLDLTGTAIAQLLPATTGAAPTIGLFRNDGTGGKLGYYADGSAVVAAGSCDEQGRRTVTVTLQMDYSAPSSGLSAYVLGYARAGPYVLRTDVMVFAPPNSSVESILVDGQRRPAVKAQENGRNVAMVTIDQQPAQHVELTASLLIPASPAVAATFTPDLVITPGIRNWATSAAAYSACPPGR